MMEDCSSSQGIQDNHNSLVNEDETIVPTPQPTGVTYEQTDSTGDRNSFQPIQESQVASCSDVGNELSESRPFMSETAEESREAFAKVDQISSHGARLDSLSQYIRNETHNQSDPTPGSSQGGLAQDTQGGFDSGVDTQGVADSVDTEGGVDSGLEDFQEPSSTTEEAVSHLNDPYGYLNRDEYTSERFKVQLGDMPKFYGYNELKKLINKKLKLKSTKIKVTAGGARRAFVNFTSQDDRSNAIKILNGYTWKKAVLSATEAQPAQDPLVRKRATLESSASSFKRMKTDNTAIDNKLTVAECVRNATIPWYNIPYAEQLKRKNNDVRAFLGELTSTLYELNPHFARKKEGEFICYYEDVFKSPVTEGYRNKSEFTIGYNPETMQKTVGYRISSYKNGCTGVGPVDHLIHLPPAMKAAASLFEAYIRSTNVNPYDPETHQGVWKQLTVRTTRHNHLMMIVLIEVNELTDSAKNELTSSMKTHFSTIEGLNITSFYVKEAEKHGQPKINIPNLLFGVTTITEKLWKFNISISPESFYQVNSMAAEVLYGNVCQVASVGFDTSVIDICCGTGTISLCLARNSAEVFGIEMVLDAVRDANLNAFNNQVGQYCTFVAGKAEDLMDVVIAKSRRDKIIAVVDPPRAGLHSRVIQCIRKTAKIQSLIYVACDVRAAMKNILDLCRPTSNTYRGVAFIPTKVLPVDMFPHTPRLEYVILFERCDSFYANLKKFPCGCCKAIYCNGLPAPAPPSVYDDIEPPPDDSVEEQGPSESTG